MIAPLGRGYSQDKPAAGSAAAIPACGDDNTDTDADDGGLQELFGPNDGTGDAGEGTNDKGQCVVHVTAPEDTADADNNATRGAHTLNFEISATVKASAVIEVAGKPASISTDAPDRVDPASVTEITVSVFDDEDVLVGITEVTVPQGWRRWPHRGPGRGQLGDDLRRSVQVHLHRAFGRGLVGDPDHRG